MKVGKLCSQQKQTMMATSIFQLSLLIPTWSLASANRNASSLGLTILLASWQSDIQRRYNAFVDRKQLEHSPHGVCIDVFIYPGICYHTYRFAPSTQPLCRFRSISGSSGVETYGIANFSMYQRHIHIVFIMCVYGEIK